MLLRGSEIGIVIGREVEGANNVRSRSSGQSKGRYGRRTGTHNQGGGDPDHQRCPGVPDAPDDTVTAISIFDDYAGAEESNKRVLAWIEQSLAPLLTGPASAVAGPVIVHTLA
jgi:hypothetical protein